MPRRAVDKMTVTKLNRHVREIDEGKRPPALIRVGGVGGLRLNIRRRDYASGPAISASWVLRRTHESRHCSSRVFSIRTTRSTNGTMAICSPRGWRMLWPRFATNQ